jgi:hypothetical protein
MGENDEPIKSFLDRIGSVIDAGMILSDGDQKRIYSLAVWADEQDTAEIYRLRSELEASRGRVAELEAAIKPFARLADIESDGRRDDEIFYSRHGGPDRTVKLTHGDLRRAHFTLEGKQDA